MLHIHLNFRNCKAAYDERVAEFSSSDVWLQGGHDKSI